MTRYSGITSSRDLLEIVKGNMSGYDRGEIIGTDPILNTTEHTIWPINTDVPIPLTSAVSMSVSSDDANDDASGTGVRLLYISGIGDDGLQIDEIVTMSGTTATPTSNSYVHINQLVQVNVGSNRTNIGNIYVGTGTVTAGVPDTVYNMIEPDDGVSRSAFYLVPSDKYLSIIDSTTSVNGNKIATTRFCTHTAAGRICGAESHLQTYHSTAFPYSALIPPNTFIEIRGKINSGTGGVDVALGYILIPLNEVNL